MYEPGMPTRRSIQQAFILGAGQGTRLRPLTNCMPKPLVPLHHRPLAARIVDACMAVGIRRFAINTHHLPDAWQGFAGSFEEPAPEIRFFHEPVLLDTGGGLKNIASWVGDDPVLVHNGDIFTTLPLERLISTHMAGDAPVTLALRSHGPEKRVALDVSGSRVTDLRHALGVHPGTHGFAGVYCADPEFLDLLPASEVISVIPAFLELARHGRLAAVVIDEGEWLDLGDRESYLLANRVFDPASAVHPSARISPDACIVDSVIGPDSVVESGALVRESVLWPGSQVRAGSDLERCIVFSGKPIVGRHRDADLRFCRWSGGRDLQFVLSIKKY